MRACVSTDLMNAQTGFRQSCEKGIQQKNAECKRDKSIFLLMLQMVEAN